MHSKFIFGLPQLFGCVLFHILKNTFGSKRKYVFMGYLNITASSCVRPPYDIPGISIPDLSQNNGYHFLNSEFLYYINEMNDFTRKKVVIIFLFCMNFFI